MTEQNATFKHYSVMLEECIEALAIKPDGVYVDGTAGGAGHSQAIAQRLSAKGRLIALDKDPDAIKAATQRLAPYPQAKVVQSDFCNVDTVLDALGIAGMDGILLDLGVSSHQLDCAERGFSYQHNAKLDMRMSQEGMSAWNIVNEWDERQIARILREYAEEKFAAAIARNIVKRRQTSPIDTTFELNEIIKASIPAPARREGGNPCKRTYQALRIAVNGELESLSQALDAAFEKLNPGGRFVVITFHSLEDRMVKQKFLHFAQGCICPKDFPVCVCHQQPRADVITKKPIYPSEQELLQNNRSHSAKLRVLQKR